MSILGSSQSSDGSRPRQEAGGAPICLSIAGSDSGGGAGIQADLATFHAYGCWATTAITAITAQNTVGVQAFEVTSPELVARQIESVCSDLPVRAVKTGMLANSKVVSTVSAGLSGLGLALVVDPVFVSKHGDTLLQDDAVDELRTSLLPLATVVTPNLPEAARLAQLPEPSSRAEMQQVAEQLLGFGPKAVLVKGGHLGTSGSPDLFMSAHSQHWLESERIESRNTHGTGCTLSAAICANLALGVDLEESVARSKEFVFYAIKNGRELGSGVGPVNPLGI